MKPGIRFIALVLIVSICTLQLLVAAESPPDDFPLYTPEVEDSPVDEYLEGEEDGRVEEAVETDAEESEDTDPPSNQENHEANPDLNDEESDELGLDDGQGVPEPGQEEANENSNDGALGTTPTPEEGAGSGADAPVFDPQPASSAEVFAAITAWLNGEDKPRWEFAVPEAMMPSGYICRLVSGDAAFGVAYYTFFAQSSLAFDPQPHSLEEVQEAIDSWLDGGPKAKWEQVVPDALMPWGYECRPVLDDEEFGADYHTFFIITIIMYDPQPGNPEEVLAAVEAWEQGSDKPRWEFEVPEAWMPVGYLCEMVVDDESFGLQYYTFFPSVRYDPQPQTQEEVQAAIDIWEEGGPMPRWQYEVSTEIMPEGYFCELVSDDADFGADYYTVFVQMVDTPLAQDSDGFYLVGTPEELDAVRDNLGANYRMYQDIHLDVDSYSSSTFTTNYGWVGIGTGRTPFTGEFDGAGYTVSGLCCKAAGGNHYSNQGLFGYTSGAYIHNLKLEVTTMTATYQIGGVVGYAVDGTRIERCKVTGELIRSTGGGYAGGIVGLCNVSDPSGLEPVIIRDCQVYSLQAGEFTISTSGDYVGGIAGAVYNTAIIDCRTSDLTVTGFSYSGGLAGLAYYDSEISGCVAERPVLKTSGSYPGGFIGSLNGRSSVADSYVIQPVITASLSYAGGFAGVVYGSSSIDSCYVVDPTQSVGVSYAGGFVGTVYETSAISHCYVDNPYATADISYVGGFGGEISNATVTDCQVLEPEVEGKSISVGGFAGFIGYGAQVLQCSVDAPLVRANHTAGGFAGDIYDNTRGVVENCVVRTPTVRTNQSEAGGFVGRLAAPTSGSYNSGRITNCVVDGGTVNTGSYYAGGFVGHSYTAKGTVEDCRVEGVTVTATTYYAGGFGGYLVSASLTLTRCAVMDTDVTGTTDIGGFGGRIYSAPVSTRCTFTDCYVNGGTVTANGGNRYAGGFVGRHYMQTYINCYSQADVRIVGGTGRGGGFAGHLAGSSANTVLRNCYATGSVTGSAGGDFGGLIGYRTNTSQLINCFATGTVRAGSGARTGGLIGYSVANISNISNCYFDTTTTRKTAGIGNRSPTAAQVKPLTTREMIDGTSIAFSFGNLDTESGDTDSPWYIQEEITYPFLHYQHNDHSAEERDHNLATVSYQDGTSLGQFRADFQVLGTVPFRVGAAGAQNAYFPYTGTSRYPVSYGTQTDVPSATFTPDTGRYSLGGVSSTGIIGFAGLPGAVKISDRPVYLVDNPVSYTYIKDIVTYEITITNHSQDYHWLDVMLRDPLPVGVTLAQVDAPVRVQYEGDERVVLQQGGSNAPSYSYTESTRELVVRLDKLSAHESGAGPQWVTVELQTLVGEEAISAQPLNPDDDHIRNRGTVSGELWDWNDSSSAGNYTIAFDDHNTDPVFALGVRYDGNGSTEGALPKDSTRYAPGDTVTVLEPGTLELSGFHFYGWSLDPAADPTDPTAIIYPPGDRLSIAYDNLVFYAVWYDTPPLAEEFVFYKVDGDSLEGLEGARFTLSYCENPLHTQGDHVRPDQPDSCWVELDNAVTSGPDGLVRLEFEQQVNSRHYLLTETKAPRGYALTGASWLIYLEDHWQVLTYVQGYAHYQADILDGKDINGDGVPDYYLPNYRERYELPDTGGPGIGGYIRIGGPLVAAGSALLLLKCMVARRHAKQHLVGKRAIEQEGDL